MKLDISMTLRSQICNHPSATVRSAITPSVDIRYLFSNGFYILKGDVGLGCWGLTYELSNCHFKSKNQIKKIVLNDREISFNELHKICYYVVQTEENLLNKLFHLKVKDIFKLALKKGNIDFTYKDIVDIFYLEEKYLNRPFYALSHNKWVYSCAIGFALGKKIFCFPWLINDEMRTQKYRFSLMSDIAQKYDLLFLLPTEKESVFPSLMEDTNKFIYLSADDIFIY